VSCHLQVWMLRSQARGQVRSDTRGGSKQEQPEAPPRAGRSQRRHEVGPGHGCADLAALSPRRPDHARAVGKAEIRRLENPRKLALSLRPHDEFGVDRGDEVMAACVDEVLDASERSAHIEAIDPDAQDPRQALSLNQGA